MRCDKCKHWKRHNYAKDKWGDCKGLTEGFPEGIEFYTNNRDGEWVETTVETEPDFFCKLFKEVQDEMHSL